MDERLMILAAGQGTRLRPLTEGLPKCMVPLHGRPLIEWHLDAAQRAGIQEVTVVAGYAREKLTPRARHVVMNPHFSTTNMVESLWCAQDLFGDGFLMAYGDIVYRPALLRSLAESKHDVAVVVDRQWLPYWQMRSENVLADAESLRLDGAGNISSIGKKETSVDNIQGQYIGLVALRRAGLEQARRLLDRERVLHAQGKRGISALREMPRLYMTDLLQALVDAGVTVSPVWTDGGWLEVDTLRDLEVAQRVTRVQDGVLVVDR